MKNNDEGVRFSMDAPCAHLVEADNPYCHLGRRFPHDCQAMCIAYSPGLTEQERTRTQVWAIVTHANA